MKSISITLLLVLGIVFGNFAFSQGIYFNNRFEYNITNMWDNSRSLLEVDDGYIIGGMTGGESIFDYYIALRKIDFQGSEVWTKIWGEQNKQYWIGEPGSLIKTLDGGYLMCGTYKDNTIIIDAALLLKFNENFDTVWTTKRTDTVTPSNYLYYYFQCKEVIDEGYIIAGIKKPLGEPSKIHLVKTDYNGNIIWEQVYGTGTYYYQTFSIIITTDGGYAVGGYRFHIGQNETADPIIYKTDSLGNLEWEKNIGGPFDDYYPVLTLGKDGNIVVGTCYADSMSNPTSAYRRINIVKMDNEGNILWNKKYGESITYNYSKQIRTLEDGSYIIAGGVKNNYPHRSGWIFKVSSGGDSLWYRQYDNLFGSDSRNYLYDIIPTSDNGFAACGYVIPYSPDTGSQDAWVLKVDSMGCDTAGCITVNSEELMVNGEQGLRIWPNPANDMFWIKPYTPPLVPPNGGKPARIVVYNSQGIKIKEILIQKGEEAVKVNVRGWQRGIYYVRMSAGGRSLGSGKVVVE